MSRVSLPGGAESGRADVTVTATTRPPGVMSSAGFRRLVYSSSLVIFEDKGHMSMFEEHVRLTELIFELVEKTAP